MDVYFAELGNVFLVVLAVVALAMHTILFLLGFAAIIALGCYVAKFIIVDLSPGKRKLALVALTAIDIALVVAAIAVAVSLRH
jgi:hypothetical protein